MKKLSIANVMLGCGLGGIEQAAIDYSEALTCAGHDVCTIIHPQAMIRKRLEATRIPFETLKNWGAWDIIAVAKLRMMLADLRADFCIAHGNRALSLLKNATARDKLIAVAHNYKIKFDNAKIIFCPSHDLLRHVRSQGIAQQNIYRIPNMVRTNPPFVWRERRQLCVIGTMGRFVAKKGFDIFIQSLSILKSQGMIFRAVMAGTGEEEKNLKALAAEHGIRDIVHFPGWIEDKDTFFDDIDIFCLPSLHEPFGIVLLEAMAHGLPSIATNSEGPSEIIINGHDGIIVEKGSAEQIALSIRQLMDEPVKFRRLSKNAFETVYEHYDIGIVSKQLENALENIVTEQKSIRL